jgi:hypothetical protein
MVNYVSWIFLGFYLELIVCYLNTLNKSNFTYDLTKLKSSLGLLAIVEACWTSIIFLALVTKQPRVSTGPPNPATGPAPQQSSSPPEPFPSLSLYDRRTPPVIIDAP